MNVQEVQKESLLRNESDSSACLGMFEIKFLISLLILLANKLKYVRFLEMISIYFHGINDDMKTGIFRFIRFSQLHK